MLRGVQENRTRKCMTAFSETAPQGDKAEITSSLRLCAGSARG